MWRIALPLKLTLRRGLYRRARAMQSALMRRSSIIATLVFLAGCHHPTATAPRPFRQTYCWWASQYVAAPPVTLASHFQQALVGAGFTDARWARAADSAWAAGGPAHLAGMPAAALVAFRVVAFAARDSASCAWIGMTGAMVVRRPAGAESCFHTDVTLLGAPGRLTADDSAQAEGRLLAICGAVYGPALAESPLLK